jgi:hypothetical protein
VAIGCHSFAPTKEPHSPLEVTHRGIFTKEGAPESFDSKTADLLFVIRWKPLILRHASGSFVLSNTFAEPVCHGDRYWRLVEEITECTDQLALAMDLAGARVRVDIECEFNGSVEALSHQR